MFDFVRQDDLVIVHSMDRLARSLDDLRRIVKELTSRGAQVQFVKENIIFKGDDSAMSNCCFPSWAHLLNLKERLLKKGSKRG